MKKIVSKLFLHILIVFMCYSAINFGLIDSVSAAAALKQGMQGMEVINLQAKLKEIGYYTGEVDGLFGYKTRMAVMDFQIDNRIEPDGIAGEHTINCLKNFRQVNVVSRSKTVNRLGQQIVVQAKQFLGVRYVWGGRTPAGFDCSGFIYYIFSERGFDLPRMADGQFEVGQWVKKSDLQQGDLVFFTTYEPGASHVGIYIGNNSFIHASSAAEQVTITSLNKPYYQERYLGARRLAY